MSFSFTDEDLISYCEMHCKTPRALFNGEQINKMIELAGYPAGFVESVPFSIWISLHDDMEELCRLARLRQKDLSNRIVDLNEARKRLKEQKNVE